MKRGLWLYLMADHTSHVTAPTTNSMMVFHGETVCHAKTHRVL